MTHCECPHCGLKLTIEHDGRAYCPNCCMYIEPDCDDLV